MSQIIPVARKLRQAWRSVMVMVVSEDKSFLTSFAECSLKKRLLASDTRLLAVTRLIYKDVSHVLRRYWTFSMMNAMILNVQGDLSNIRLKIYSHLPYTSRGRDRVVTVASWRKKTGLTRKKTGLTLAGNRQMFPQKFKNFYGSVVNVTALPYPPYWIENKSPENSEQVIYSGSDYSLLETIANSLNFTIYVLPTANWGEVTKKVELRESFMAPVIHSVLINRLEFFDYSFIYEANSLSFSFSKPKITPQWKNMYYPLSYEVWILTLVSLILMPAIFWEMCRSAVALENSKLVAVKTAFLELYGILLGQSLYPYFPKNLSCRVILGSWLIFGFILTSAYRGNLIAYLTRPKYPPRPETLKELVEIADRVTIPPYGKDYKVVFSKSNSEDLLRLSELMHFLPTAIEGLREATENRQGYLDSRRYQEYYIAKEFTSEDGTPSLYVGREDIVPGRNAWPIPHDAPYGKVLNRMLMAVCASGLYEHWSQEIMDSERRQTKARFRKKQLEQKDDDGSDRSKNNVGLHGIGPKALTISHLQGPFMLYLLGAVLALLFFVMELTPVSVSFKSRF